MRIEIVEKIDSENQKVYGFNLFDLTGVFITYHTENKAKGKRTWTITHFWDKYGRNSTIDEPELPLIIKEAALAKIQAMIKIHTWDEWKQ